MSMEVDHKRMLKAIDELVNNGLGFDVTSKTSEKPTWTQEESEWMAETIGKVYSIAHCIHCRACQGKRAME